MRRHFSLIEIVVVFALIACVAGVMTPSLYRFLGEKRFERSIETLLHKLATAQELMCYYDKDVRLTFTRSPEKVLIGTAEIRGTTKKTIPYRLSFADEEIDLPDRKSVV